MLLPILVLFGPGACGDAQPPANVHVPDAERGRMLVERFGCGNCHEIDAIAGARGVVGPDLSRFAGRTLIAGELPNVPSVLVPWLMDPPRASPGSAMPSVGLDEQQARDIAAWLYARTGDPPQSQQRNVLTIDGLRQARDEQQFRDRQRLSGGPRRMPIEEAMQVIVRNGSRSPN